MKKIKMIILSMLSGLTCVAAPGVAPVGVDSISFERHGDYMVVDMDLNLRRTKVPSSKGLIITPMIVSENGDTVALRSVGVYGHQRYINFLRNKQDVLTKDTQTTFKESERPDYYDYTCSVAYADWMSNSRLIVRRSMIGCANCVNDEKTNTITNYYEITPGVPEIKYFESLNTEPVIESLKGSSYIDFVVDKTDINPTYRRNPQELARIRATIDTVLNDKDVKITGVWLKGFASPESPYSHNRDLAIGRTAALKGYISRMYNFDPEIISTDFEPEDWAGLRSYVEKSNLPHKYEIIGLIDTEMDPDKKEALIKQSYPADYKFMLAEFYPALRHTEYRITYEVKRFDDLEKIREVMRTRPNRLTLREFFLLGNAAKPGSDEFNDIFETAVKMYPDDPVANINAANAALQRRDFVTAEKYLSRSDDSDEANYARGALAFSMGDYDRAEQLLKRVVGLPQAAVVLEEINKIRSNSVEKVKRINLE